MSQYVIGCLAYFFQNDSYRLINLGINILCHFEILLNYSYCNKLKQVDQRIKIILILLIFLFLQFKKKRKINFIN